MTDPERQALERLIKIAKSDTHQSRRVADFLLAWWNSAECGSFDLVSMWMLDTAIVNDMVVVFSWIGHHNVYPDSLGYGDDFRHIIEGWRPELLAESTRG